MFASVSEKFSALRLIRHGNYLHFHVESVWHRQRESPCFLQRSPRNWTREAWSRSWCQPITAFMHFQSSAHARDAESHAKIPLGVSMALKNPKNLKTGIGKEISRFVKAPPRWPSTTWFIIRVYFFYRYSKLLVSLNARQSRGEEGDCARRYAIQHYYFDMFAITLWEILSFKSTDIWCRLKTGSAVDSWKGCEADLRVLCWLRRHIPMTISSLFPTSKFKNHAQFTSKFTLPKFLHWIRSCLGNLAMRSIKRLHLLVEDPQHSYEKQRLSRKPTRKASLHIYANPCLAYIHANSCFAWVHYKEWRYLCLPCFCLLSLPLRPARKTWHPQLQTGH